jgi:hypothetical protein
VRAARADEDTDLTAMEAASSSRLMLMMKLPMVLTDPCNLEVRLSSRSLSEQRGVWSVVVKYLMGLMN